MNYDQFLVNLLRYIDKRNQGKVEFIEVAFGLKELGVTLTLQEIYTLMRAYDKTGDWKLSMKEYVYLLIIQFHLIFSRFYQAMGGKK